MESIYRSASHAGAPLLQSRQDAPPSLAPPGVIPNYIDPPTIGNQIVVASMTPIGFAIIFVTLRLLIKWRVIKRLGWDDCKHCFRSIVHHDADLFSSFDIFGAGKV